MVRLTALKLPSPEKNCWKVQTLLVDARKLDFVFKTPVPVGRDA